MRFPASDELVGDARDPIVIADWHGVRFVVLNRPAARNALTRAMRVDFAAMLAGADADSGVQAVVLTGAAGCCSGGVDLKDRIPGAPPVNPNPGVALRSLSKPVVAAIDGFCITGALEMALSCDFAIGTPQARFADTHCAIGLFPRWGGGHLLSSAIGVRRARQMMLAGTLIDAATALSWGLINEIVPQDDFLQRVGELASTMADRSVRQKHSWALHAAMFDAIDQLGAAAIETEILDQFDRDRSLPEQGHHP